MDYIQRLSEKVRIKINAYIYFLQDRQGYICEPYSRYVCSGIRELRVDFNHNRHRIFYITTEEKKIILLYAFLKKTRKTPRKEIHHALRNLQNYRLNKKLIEYEKE